MKHIPSRASWPRFEDYAVVDAHTGAVISMHPTRSTANAAKTEHSHRVRGVPGILDWRTALLRRLGIGGRR